MLFYSALAGLFKAIWYGLFDIMKVTLSVIQELASKISFSDPTFPSFVNGIERAMNEYQK